MNIGQPSASSIAGLVWTQTTRGITSVQAAHTIISGQSSIAAGAIADLRPSAGKIREVTSFLDTNATSWVGGFYNGATLTANNASLLATASHYGVGDSTIGIGFKNNNAGAVNLTFIGNDWS